MCISEKKRVVLACIAVFATLLLCCAGGAMAEDGNRVLRLPAGLKVIEEEAFARKEYSSSKKFEIILPDTLQEIHSKAFSKTLITKINLPDSLTWIADDAFMDSKLETVEAKEGTYGYMWALRHAYIDAEGVYESTLHYSITKGICTITGLEEGVTSVVVPETIMSCPVTSIALKAFYNHATLTEIDLPESLTDIEQMAFQGCMNLRRVSLPESLKTMGTGVFGYCESLTDIVIPSGIDYIPAGTFEFCYNLERVKIASKLRSVGHYAFEYCRSLQSIDISSDGESIEDGIIGHQAFYECEKLERLHLSSRYTTIGNSAFSGCSNLREIGISPALTSIGSGAFENCELLDGVVLPSSLKKIDYGAFSACHSLSRIDLPAQLDLGYRVFQDCTGLQYASFAGAPSRIRSYLFLGCSSLKGVMLSSDMTTLLSDTFYGCNNLTTVYGVKGSFAEEWAKENNLIFIDVNEGIQEATFRFLGEPIRLGVGQVYEPQFEYSYPIRGVNYMSWDDSVLTVDNGTSVRPLWMAHKVGRATVTAITAMLPYNQPDQTRTVSTEVVVCLYPSLPSVEIDVGNTVTLDALWLESVEGSVSGGVWTAEDEGVVHLYQTGLPDGQVAITGVGAGKTRLIYTMADGMYTTVEVEVFKVSEEAFEQALTTVKAGENAMDNPVIFHFIHEGIQAFLWNSCPEEERVAYADTVAGLVRSAPEDYRNLFVFSFNRYKIVGESGPNGHEMAFNGDNNTLYFPKDNHELSDYHLASFFHECGHAIDWNAGSVVHLTRSSTQLFDALKTDCLRWLNTRMTRWREQRAAQGTTISDEEAIAIITAVLDPRNMDTYYDEYSDIVDENTESLKKAEGLYSAYQADYTAFVVYCCHALQEDIPRLYKNQQGDSMMYGDLIAGITNSAILPARSAWAHSGNSYWYRWEVPLISMKPNYLINAEAWAEYFSSIMTRPLNNTREHYQANTSDDVARVACGVLDSSIVPAMKKAYGIP